MTERMPQGGLPLVLLTGDGQEATRWLRSLLEGGGYAVLQERSGQHALERARTTEPDVILVDAELPDMPGVELCRALRADPRVSSSTPILLMIREAATRAQRLAALRAGAWECIAPPHDADEILLKIGAYVHAKLDADRARTEGLLDAATGLYNRQGLARRARELGSQAFREHGPLACIVLALDVEPPEPGAAPPQGGTGLGRYVQAIKSAARLSDVIGRLSATEFAVPPRHGCGGGAPPRGAARQLRGRDDRDLDRWRRRGFARSSPLRLRSRGQRRLRPDRAGRSLGTGGRRGPDRARGLRRVAAPL